MGEEVLAIPGHPDGPPGDRHLEWAILRVLEQEKPQVSPGIIAQQEMMTVNILHH